MTRRDHHVAITRSGVLTMAFVFKRAEEKRDVASC